MSTATDYFQKQSIVLDGRYRAAAMGKGNESDTGTNREGILADWLAQHLPRTISPEIGGQIIDHAGHSSNQIDIVVYNDDAPRFGGNPKQYYFAEGVIAAIQVKSKLTSTSLAEALRNLATAKTCKLRPRSGMTMGKRSENIITGIFAFEPDSKDFSSIQSLIDALKRHEDKDEKPVNFVCVNKTSYIVYNEGEWHSENEKKEKIPMSKGYVEIDSTDASIFRMVLALSSEAKRNVATSVDFQPYFIHAWGTQ